MATQEVKPGYKTTEFWLTISVHVAAILETVSGLLPPAVAGIVMTVVQAFYTYSRMRAKTA